MSKIARYQGNVRAFASDAQGMERTVFGGTNQADDLTSQITASFLRGWGIVGASEHPSLEDFNAAMYAMSQFIAYQHQMGVPEWHAEQEYHIGSICTHNGESYQSLQNANIGSQPPSAKWTPVLTSKNGLANLGLGETAKQAAGAMQKSQNGGDIPDIDLFVRNIGAARAFNGGINIGGDSGSWTTAEFITWLESQGAFNHPYWMCKGSWAYDSNKVITDTGCGSICLAGAVVEVMGTGGAITIRVTTPTTTSGGGVPSAQFIYINHGDGYAPGWRRDFSRTGDEMTGNLYLKNEGRINFAIVNEDGTPRMWLFKDKGGDGVHINNGNDGGGDFIFGKDGSFYASAVRAGLGRKLTVRSDNNSALSAHFNLWGGGERPTVIELDDDQGWHFYSQRRQDGGIELSVNGNIYPANYSNFDARYLTSGNVYTKGESDNRYVQNIQRGAPVWPGKVDEYGPAEAPAGCFLTQARHDPTTAYGVTFAYRPLQMWVGNGWRTING
ncbi:hypothetical protein NB797_002488 [Salmonella enterica subsp. enterica serovar Minnesota]|nr:hypothetical protein [Salmonella enterica subsp. enterica serovar Minnesota]EJG9945241.1 hypothetical protein [Salmonella enterica subsp. enterica serovar Minnesota]